MRSQRAAHVAVLSLKARSAIMLAGHGGDAVTWLSDTFDGWETSSAFSRGPVPAVKAFVDAHPIDADYGKPWTRLLPDARYLETDAGLGEAPPNGWTASFPHVLKGAGTGTPDADFRAQWERSPFGDAYLAHFAESLVESMSLGRHTGTDVLGIGFSSPDLVGHAFGPASQEVRDIYAHLDRTIGGLLDRLDTLVGRNRYIVVLSADHGVSPIPEQTISKGLDGGRLDSPMLTGIVERAAQKAAGPGRYLARVSGNDVYFEPGMYDKLKATGPALDAVTRAIQAEPGIARVFAAEDLRSGATSTDRLRRAAALSYVPGRSGDLIVVPKLGWMFSARGTTHATASPDDQRVPIILMGPGVKAGEYREEVTPADIAPTLAALCGITMSRSEGRVLWSALTFSPPAASAARPRSR
jgi:predicted AlkP superfamily pyrophosphatase or phosphodiesterase